MNPPISMKKSKWESLGIKTRKHHNNTGYRQIKRGKTRSQVERIAKKLKIPYGKRTAWLEDNQMQVGVYTIKFSVKFFENNEGGMRCGQYGESVSTIEDAVKLLELANASNEGSFYAEWVIVAEVERAS